MLPSALTTPMPRLTSFELMLSEVTSAQLATLLAPMPQLHTLVLISLDNVDSLLLSAVASPASLVALSPPGRVCAR